MKIQISEIEIGGIITFGWLSVVVSARRRGLQWLNRSNDRAERLRIVVHSEMASALKSQRKCPSKWNRKATFFTLNMNSGDLRRTYY